MEIFFSGATQIIWASLSTSSHETSGQLPMDSEKALLPKTRSAIGTEIYGDLKMQLTTTVRGSLN